MSDKALPLVPPPDLVTERPKLAPRIRGATWYAGAPIAVIDQPELMTVSEFGRTVPDCVECAEAVGWSEPPPHPSSPLTEYAATNYAIAPPVIMSDGQTDALSLPTQEWQQPWMPSADVFGKAEPMPAAAPVPLETPMSTQPAKEESNKVPVVQEMEPPITPACASGLKLPCLLIEYCDRCRWQHRATWVQTELLLTFSEKEYLKGTSSKASGGGYLASTMLLPCATPETSGRFRVWVAMSSQSDTGSDIHLLWDRKKQGGFPELAELKRLLRDYIAPSQSLGHSEKQK